LSGCLAAASAAAFAPPAATFGATVVAGAGPWGLAPLLAVRLFARVERGVVALVAKGRLVVALKVLLGALLLVLNPLVLLLASVVESLVVVGPGVRVLVVVVVVVLEVVLLVMLVVVVVVVVDVEVTGAMAGMMSTMTPSTAKRMKLSTPTTMVQEEAMDGELEDSCGRSSSLYSGATFRGLLSTCAESREFSMCAGTGGGGPASPGGNAGYFVLWCCNGPSGPPSPFRAFCSFSSSSVSSSSCRCHCAANAAAAAGEHGRSKRPRPQYV